VVLADRIVVTKIAAGLIGGLMLAGVCRGGFETRPYKSPDLCPVDDLADLWGIEGMTPRLKRDRPATEELPVPFLPRSGEIAATAARRDCGDRGRALSLRL
jgi:hypothetical protein